MSDEAVHDHLQAVYAATTDEELAAGYAAWAASYDRDVLSLGYQVPAVVAAMAARHLAPGTGPLLDCGAGTGMLGLLLAALGYDDLVAIDMSEEMLTVARGRRAYGSCRRMLLGERLDFADDSFAGCLAAGVFTVGHAPPESLPEIARVTRPGGLAIFSVRSDGEVADRYLAVAEALSAAGAWSLVERSARYQAFTLSAEEADIVNRVLVYRVA